MELTPINIRKKRRRRRREVATDDLESSLVDLHAPASRAKAQNKARRTKMQARYEEHNYNYDNTSKGKHHNTAYLLPDRNGSNRTPFRKRPRASALERDLPLEIMERIFWMSENMSFARSSPRIGYLLSGTSTRRETLLYAFGPTWDVWFGCLAVRESKSALTRARDSQTVGAGPVPASFSVKSYYGWRTDAERFGGNPAFQSAVLEYSWVTVSFILECWDIWVKRNGKGRSFHHEKLWIPQLPNPLLPTPTPALPGDAVEQDQDGDEAAQENPQPNPPLAEEPTQNSTIEGTILPGRIYFQEDYQSFCQLTDDGYPHSHDYLSWIEIHPLTKIPTHLITGPWNDEALAKLFWLVRAGARLSTPPCPSRLPFYSSSFSLPPSPDHTWETTLEGYQKAMADTDPPTGAIHIRIVRLLYILSNDFGDWPEHVLVDEYEKLEGLMQSGAMKGRIDVYVKYASVAAMLLRTLRLFRVSRGTGEVGG